MPLKSFSTEMAEPRRAGKTSLDREILGFLLEQGMGSQLMGIVGKGAGMATLGFPSLQFHPSARERSLCVWSSSSGTRQGHSNTRGENTELLLFWGQNWLQPGMEHSLWEEAAPGHSRGLQSAGSCSLQGLDLELDQT